MVSEPVRPFGLTWPDVLESVCLRSAPYGGVAARVAASPPSWSLACRA